MEIIGNVIDTIVNAPVMVASLVGFVALVAAIIALLKKAINETIEAYKKVKWFIKKYKDLFSTGAGKVDFDVMVKEIDDALNSYAAVLDKFKLKKQANALRDLIKLSP